jgi:hypothetical protein
MVSHCGCSADPGKRAVGWGPKFHILPF